MFWVAARCSGRQADSRKPGKSQRRAERKRSDLVVTDTKLPDLYLYLRQTQHSRLAFYPHLSEWKQQDNFVFKKSQLRDRFVKNSSEIMMPVGGQMIVTT
jgi:hypothetical protein